MAGRALAFSDPDIIRMASEQFVPVTGDDWYQRRRQDAEGEFFRKIAAQRPGPDPGPATRQGIYLLTADGKLLGYRNAGQHPDLMRQVLRAALANWNQLPASEREPGAFSISDLEALDARYSRTPPPGALVLKVNTRALERAPDGDSFHPIAKKIGSQAARDHLWIRKEEWQSLLPQNPRPGMTIPIPPALGYRILRFHLVDNTRGEPPFWKPEELRSSQLTLTVDEIAPRSVRLKLHGHALLSTSSDPENADRGYDARILGFIDYSPEQKIIKKFQAVALGDHWGEGAYTRNARPGRTPLGIAFELVENPSPADLIPPQAARTLSEYYQPHPRN